MAQIEEESPPHIDLFRYLSADERVDYIAIMTRFTSSLLADMSATTVNEQLRAVDYVLDTDLVEARCKQLVRWGNLVPSLRDARVNTVADYLRARSRFQVTSLGGRVHRSALEIMAASDGAREVARELLGQIAELLGQIPPLVRQPPNAEQADQLAGIVTTIFNNQRLFTASVTDFYAYLSGVLSRFDLAASEYAEFKSLLLDYIDLITADVNRHSPIIATGLESVIAKLDQMLEILGGVQSLNLGPGVQVERSSGRTRTEWEELHRWYTDAGTESGRRNFGRQPGRHSGSSWRTRSACSTHRRLATRAVLTSFAWQLGSIRPRMALLTAYSTRPSALTLPVICSWDLTNLIPGHIRPALGLKLIRSACRYPCASAATAHCAAVAPVYPTRRQIVE